MRVAIGSDHAGFELKVHLATTVGALGHDVVDLGTDGTDSVDYPPFCAAVGRAVVRGDADRGIVIGGSGQGEQLAANKVRGVRAGLCNDLYTAGMSRRHNDANVLSIGARIVGTGLADEIVELWLTAEFEGGRHQQRIDQISALEDRFADPAAQDAYMDTLVHGLTARGGDTVTPPSQEAPPLPYEGDSAS